MIRSTTLIAAALVVALGATLAGCAAPPSIRGTQAGSGSASSETTATDATATVLPGESGSTTPSEIKAVDQQLDAMQREIDSLSMPADSDFGSAESALY